MLKTVASLANAAELEIGNEPFRPQYHFSPRRNWLNDPNGLVYFEGEYHLFFQYNPQGKDWGNMSWGHAISPDLIHWRELPVAIPHTDQMIFSGSAIIDWKNDSGLGDGEKPPLLAFFTAFDPTTSIQSQHLAYSHDRGRSFSHYAANPIIDLDMKDFRDPKVFYHEESAAWIMVLAMAREHVIQFYRSANLRDWSLSGIFNETGSVAGQWECPDLILVPVEGDANRAYWVLKIDVDTGLVDGGSGAQYFVGHFDGYTFTIDADLADQDGALVDYGPDFYAAVTWSDLPKSRTKPIWIGWQSNHQSGKVYPTDPWRGAMSLPRELFLYETRNRLRLGQRPISEIEVQRDRLDKTSSLSLDEGAKKKIPLDTSSFEIELAVASAPAAEVLIQISDEEAALLSMVICFGGETVSFSRHTSKLAPAEDFARSTTACLSKTDAHKFQIFFDGSLIEIFVDGGATVYSAALFPNGQLNLFIQPTLGNAEIACVKNWTMKRSIDFVTPRDAEISHVVGL